MYASHRAKKIIKNGFGLSNKCITHYLQTEQNLVIVVSNPSKTSGRRMQKIYTPKIIINFSLVATVQIHTIEHGPMPIQPKLGVFQMAKSS